VLFILTYTLLKTLPFLFTEWLWALDPGFQCCATKKGKSAYSPFFFFRLVYSSRSRAAKKHGRPSLVVSVTT
jgi:hypothetical protein